MTICTAWPERRSAVITGAELGNTHVGKKPLKSEYTQEYIDMCTSLDKLPVQISGLFVPVSQTEFLAGSINDLFYH